MLNRPLAVAISGYQRYISPYKGFCCAHKALHGGPSCSDYVKQTVLTHGLWRGMPAIRQRFSDCKAASVRMSSHEQDQRRDRNRQRDRESVLQNCDCCDVIDLIPSDGCGAASGGADACSCTPW